MKSSGSNSSFPSSFNRHSFRYFQSRTLPATLKVWLLSENDLMPQVTVVLKTLVLRTSGQEIKELWRRSGTRDCPSMCAGLSGIKAHYKRNGLLFFSS